MSIFGAMFAGVSGLTAQSQAIGMISDNIANVNTVGYKGLRTSFSTLVTQSGSQTLHSPGGVQSRPVQSADAQGLLQSTTSVTDVAIVGNGFYVVNEAAAPGPGNDYLYTRAGQFTTDENGDLINSGGYYLQGWPLDPTTGALPATPSVLSSTQTVNVSSLSGNAVPTTAMSLGANLPSTAANGETHSITAQIFDALGNAHNLQVDFVYDSATPEWDITVNDPTLASTGAVSGTVAGPVARSIAFDGFGTPSAITFPDIDITWTATTSAPSTISTNLGTLGQTDGITQFAGNFAISFINQDGVRFGNFTGVNIDNDGIVTALFDNGQQQAIYKLPLAVFPAPNSLELRDGNAYIETDGSGNVILLEANTGAAGSVSSSSLEASTVDLADEFTNMIVTQRAYSANAKIITTADEMLEELIRIRR
ncbi:MAG: flagellar hook protein FlgE [Kiloniellales bacterium]|nr:flagellar hook protein FlgE [Kiloniellales bacterium]